MNNRFNTIEDELDRMFKERGLPPELKVVDDNMNFEKKVESEPVPTGIGNVEVFGYETWDINSILKGNYWRRSIYTTDKLCKLFLKADLNQKKKYLRKRNPVSFNFLWLLLIVVIGIVALLVIIFLLPNLGGISI
jgi:hypothetical protein